MDYLNVKICVDCGAADPNMIYPVTSRPQLSNLSNYFIF